MSRESPGFSRGECQGYNVDLGGLTSGRHSPETLQKISNSMKRMWKEGTYKRDFTKETLQKMSDAKHGLFDGGNNPAARAVICLETGEIFSSVKEAAIAKNICRGTIRNYLSGKYKGGGGYHWKYVKDQ